MAALLGCWAGLHAIVGVVSGGGWKGMAELGRVSPYRGEPFFFFLKSNLYSRKHRGGHVWYVVHRRVW